MSNFTILTYNIDSSEHNYEERLGAFFEIVKDSNPDLVSIQEARRITYEIILRKMGEFGYKRYLPIDVQNRQTGEALFSKYRMEETQFLPFVKSGMKGGITISKIYLDNESWFWFMTSQFDETFTIKKTQVKDLGVLLRKFDGDIFFAGDTRILNYQKNLSEPDGWFDAWYEAGSSKEEYTYDSRYNRMAVDPLRDRPDRIWYKSDKECVSYNLVGKESEITVSSHFGVMTEFSFD